MLQNVSDTILTNANTTHNKQNDPINIAFPLTKSIMQLIHTAGIKIAVQQQIT